MHSAGRPALPDGENVAPSRQHLHSQRLLRAALRELRFQLRRSALGASRAERGREALADTGLEAEESRAAVPRRGPGRWGSAGQEQLRAGASR